MEGKKNRTIKQNCTVEDPQKGPEKKKKNEPLEQLKWTQPLKRERPKNKPGKRNKYNYDKSPANRRRQNH